MVGPFTRLVERVSLTYYDLVLAVIPSVFVLAVLVGNLLSVPAHHAIAGAALLAALTMVDALFGNPPTPGSGG